jgi:putative ABC transport system permease protein
MTLATTPLRNLVRNRRRTILTTLSIAASLFVFSVLMSLPGVFGQILADRVGTLRVIAHSISGPMYTLPEAYRGRIAKQPHVEQVAAFTLFAGIYHLPSDQFPNFAVDPDAIETMWPDWGITPALGDAFRRDRIACLVGQSLMARFGWQVGRRIALRGTIYPVTVELDIVGVLADKAPPIALLFRRDYLEEILGKPGLVNLFWVKADSSAAIPAVIDEIDRQFANSSARTQSESEAGYFSLMAGFFRPLIALAEGLALLTVFAIMLVAANTAAMSIRERRFEIAVMRAMGFTSRTILASLLAEGLLMGLVGAAAGCVLGVVALRIAALGSAALGPLAFALHLTPMVVGETLLAGALMGLGAAFIPGVIAVRANIVATLRAVA